MKPMLADRNFYETNVDRPDFSRNQCWQKELSMKPLLRGGAFHENKVKKGRLWEETFHKTNVVRRSFPWN